MGNFYHRRINFWIITVILIISINISSQTICSIAIPNPIYENTLLFNDYRLNQAINSGIDGLALGLFTVGVPGVIIGLSKTEHYNRIEMLIPVSISSGTAAFIGLSSGIIKGIIKGKQFNKRKKKK